jgi:hypothetical protein
MASALQTYQQEMHANLGFFGTWLPGDPIEVGDIGVVERGRFRKYSSLEELKITFGVAKTDSSQNVQYASRSGASLDIGASAEVPGVPGVSANIDVQFSHEGAFIFHASELRLEQLQDRSAASAAIVRAYEAGKWTKEWLIVESVHHAKCATVIVAEEGSAGVVLKAQAPVSLGALPLANPNVRLDIQSSRGRMTQVIAGRGIRPLYSCLRISDRWLSAPRVVAVRGAAAGPAEMALERPSIDDLLNS